MATIQEILNALEIKGCKPKRTDNGWEARCPAHDDKNPSLAIAEGTDGKVLMNCFVGCSFESIINALDIKRSTQRRNVATYQYTDEHGKELYSVHRLEPKGFYQSKPDGNGSRINKLGDVRRVPYRLPGLLRAVNDQRPVLIVEGEKDVATAERMGFAATCNVGGAGKFRSEYAQYFKGAKEIIIIPDDDKPGRKHAKDIARILNNENVKILNLPDAKDLTDWASKNNGNFDNILKQSILASEFYDNKKRVISITAEDLFRMNIPPKVPVLEPWIFSQDINMIYGWRGIGKTQVSVGIAVAIAGGGKFLKWYASKKHKVLFIDGELPLSTIQARISEAISITDGNPDNHLTIITPDLQKYGMPNIASEDGQLLLEKHIDNNEVIILDNLSSLARGIDENKATDWDIVNTWLLGLRAKKKTVIYIHHAGKNNSARGTSRREDNIDVSLELKTPADYDPEEGARFEVHFKKARGLSGNAVRSFSAKLDAEGWQTKYINNLDAVREMIDLGMSTRDMASDLGLSMRHVQRLVKKANDPE